MVFFPLFLQAFAWFLAIAAVLFLCVRAGVFRWLRQNIRLMEATSGIAVVTLVLALFMGYLASHPYKHRLAFPPQMHSVAPTHHTTAIPLGSLFRALRQMDQFERVDDIGADPHAVPQPASGDGRTVHISLTAQEVIAEVSPGSFYNYWTFDKQVPGPMLRVREGDTVELTLRNHESSLHEHSIDLHAVTGPGGGAAVLKVMPGEEKTLRWKALQPGLYVYHCATPNVSVHNSHGQYGLILVEPEEGLPPVDHELYVMQGELYARGSQGAKGLLMFDPVAVLEGSPRFITFNGRVEDAPRMHVKTGDRIRIYVGNGGVNFISSFHVIGEIFDVVYPEASIGGSLFRNVQTTAVLPGGAAIVEFTVDVPGKYLLVDHALARMNKGAWAVLEAEGEARPDVYQEL